MTTICEKEKVLEILKNFGYRVIDVPAMYSSSEGALVIINGDKEEILYYRNEECG